MHEDSQYIFPKSILKTENYNKQNNEQKKNNNQFISNEKIGITNQNIEHNHLPSTSSGSTYSIDFDSSLNQTSQLQKKKVEFDKNSIKTINESSKKNFDNYKNIKESINKFKINNQETQPQQQQQQQHFYEEELFLKLEQSFKVNFI